jgi:ketol-acid reductoisomerase
MKLIVDLLYEGGIANMRYSISNTAEYGDLTRGSRVITSQTKAEMKKILQEIQSGEFVREFMNENKTGKKNFDALRLKGKSHSIEAVGEKLRDLMPWIAKGKLVDKNKN